MIRALLEPHDPVTAVAWSREALELARTFGDNDLELCALCEVGVALTGMGRVDEGLALLGEAMAGALGGEAARLDTVMYCCCRMIVTCSLASEFDRAAKWIRAAEDFTRRYGGIICKSCAACTTAACCLRPARWEEAEDQLLEASRMSEGAERVLHAEALARLAGLRIAQGRSEEAIRLLAGSKTGRSRSRLAPSCTWREARRRPPPSRGASRR